MKKSNHHDYGCKDSMFDDAEQKNKGDFLRNHPLF